jgi:multiple antibiotic resistance protein
VRNFAIAFVTLFVAVDALGVFPLFISLTEGLAPRERRRIILQSLLTAVIAAVLFVFFAKKVFDLIGIKVEDFMVAGGVLLFAIALLELVSGRKFARQVETVGAVPLGIPLIVGPAVLTSSLILVDVAGAVPTLAAIVLNIAIAGAVFLGADLFTRLLGQAGSRAVSKVAALIMAAFAVMMIRRGVAGILAALAATATPPTT